MRRVTQDLKSKENNLKCIYFIFYVAENYKVDEDKYSVECLRVKNVYILSNS